MQEVPGSIPGTALVLNFCEHTFTELERLVPYYKSVDPESNQGPSDLQSDALPTELSTGDYS